MRIGAIDYHFRGEDDPARFLEARRMGFDGLEIMLTRAELRDPAQARLASLQRARQASGLAVASLLLDEHNRARGLGFSDPRAAAEAAEDLRQAVAWAAALGSSVILVPFFEAAEIVDEAAFERAAQGLRAVCPEAASQGVDLCYEGTLPAAGIQRLAREAGGRGFGCYFDTANVIYLGLDPAVEIRALGPLVRQVHLKDLRHIPGDCRLGQGLVDFKAVARALRDVGFDGWLVGEYTEYPEAPGALPPPPPEIVTHDLSVSRRFFPEVAGSAPWPSLGAAAADGPPGNMGRLVSEFSAAGLSQVVLTGSLLRAAAEDPGALAQIRDLLAAGGLRLAAVDSQAALVEAEPAAREAARAWLSRCIKAAAAFGATVLVARAGGLRLPEPDFPAPDSDEAWALLRSALDGLLPEAERHGVLLALRAGGSQVLRTQADLLRLVEAYPTKFLCLAADPQALFTPQLMPAWQRLLGSYFDRFGQRFAIAFIDPIGDGSGQPAQLVGQYLGRLRARRPDLALIVTDAAAARQNGLARRLREWAQAAHTEEA